MRLIVFFSYPPEAGGHSYAVDVEPHARYGTAGADAHAAVLKDVLGRELFVDSEGECWDAAAGSVVAVATVE